MKIKILFAMILSLFSGLLLANSATLTMASYNIHHSRGQDGLIDPQRIAKVLEEIDADIIALQEVDMINGRSNFSDQSKAIAYWLSKHNEANYQAKNAPAIDFEQGQYGNAIIYHSDKLSLQSFKNVELPDVAEGDGKRSAAIAVFKLNNGQQLQFVSTHFSHKNKVISDKQTLQQQTFAVLQSHLDENLPTFIAGDFNADANKQANHHYETFVDILKNGWHIDSKQEGLSVPNEPFIIDYILSKNTNEFKILSNEIVINNLTKIASDHYPIKVTYQLNHK